MKKLLLAICSVFVACGTNAEIKTRNVLLVTIDGLRWQDVFRGADDGMANKEFGGVSDKALVLMQAEFARETTRERREVLMPFLWNVVAKKGQIFGNRDLSSPMRVTNPASISYPGYNEMLAGFPDPGLTGNAPVPNPNVTVLEWLNQRPGFAGRIKPVAAWTVFEAIFNPARSGLPVWVTGRHSDPAKVTPTVLEIERWMEDIPSKEADEHFDGFVYRAALDAIETTQPRVLFVGLGEPDTDAHRRDYGRYLSSTRRSDRFIRQLWEAMQARPEYRGTTTLVITTDHGRGESPKEWANHSKKAIGSDETWLAVMGPDTPALGERRDTALITTSQVAATIAALLGEDFIAAEPRAALPISSVLP